MTSWINNAIRRLSTINANNASPQTRRQSTSSTFPPEVAQFKKMVSELNREDDPMRCIDFFLANINQLSTNDFNNYALWSDFACLIRRIAHIINRFFPNRESTEKIFKFLISSMRVYSSHNRTNLSIYKIVIKLMQTNSIQTIETGVSFVQQCFDKPDLLTLFFSGNQLLILWSICFVENEFASKCLGQIIYTAASKYAISDIESFNRFKERAIQDFNEGQIQSNLATNTLFFIGSIVHSINTGDFLPTLFPIICDLSLTSSTLLYFEYFLQAKTSDPPAAWSALDAICYNQDLPIEVLQSALVAIQNSHMTPDPEVFSFNSFIPRYIELDQEYQDILFEIMRNSTSEIIADFLCYVMPLSETSVNTDKLLNLISGVNFKGNLIDNVILKLFVEPEFLEVQLCIDSDSYFYSLTENLLKQINAKTESNSQLFEIFTKIASENPNSITLLEIIMLQSDPNIYMKQLIDTLKALPIPEIFLDLYTKVAYELITFNDVFFEFNGIEVIESIIQTDIGLDFLATLVVDGPNEIVDDYIFHHFKTSVLSSYDEKKLLNLMMGVTSKSQQSSGFLRIPSLGAFVSNVPLQTPYDQFIYGSIATKYFKPTKEQMMKFAIRYMNTEIAMSICEDAESLIHVTDPIFPHYNLYQIHPSARRCYFDYLLATTTSFWFMVNSIEGPTTIASFNQLQMKITPNGNLNFGSSSVYCPFKVWHLLTFVTTEKSNSKNLITLYLDATKVGTIASTNCYTFRIGDENPNNCKALWFVSSFLYFSNTIFSKDEIQKLFNKGPNASGQKMMKTSRGIKLVPYRGILLFMHLFGGPYFIFNSMLKCTNKEQFMFYMQSAFNLYNLKIFGSDDFFSSIHYIIRRKMELFTPQIEQMILLELGREKEFDWSGLQHVIGDAVVLASPYISSRFLLQALQINKICKKSIPFFHLLIDTFVFFNTDLKSQDKQTLLSKDNFLNVLRHFIEFQPSLIKKIIIAALIIPFCDSDGIHASFSDQRFRHKQKLLLDFIMNDVPLFTSQITFLTSLSLASKLEDDLCLYFLDFIAKICLKSPDYFNYTHLEKYLPHFYFLIKNEKFWVFLFTLLTNKQENSIESYTKHPISRSKLLTAILNLANSLISLEFEHNLRNENTTSFQIIKTVFGMLDNHSISLTQYQKEIQNLCSFGFGEMQTYPYPYTILSNSQSNRRSSRPLFWKFTSETNNEEQSSQQNTEFPKFDFQRLYDLDQQLFDVLKKYLLANPVNADQISIQIPSYPLPEDDKILDTFFESNLVDFITSTVVHTLTEIEKGNFNQFKKSLTMFTILGSDCPPNIATRVHKKIIVKLIDQMKQFTGETNNYIIEFLTYRVVEGWWGYENDLSLLFDKLIHFNSKSMINFVIAALSIQRNQQFLIQMAVSFCRHYQLFESLLSIIDYGPSFIFLITKTSILKDEQSLQELISQFTGYINQKGNDHFYSDFISLSTNPDKITYLNNICKPFYDEVINPIKSTATTNSQKVIEERNENTIKAKTTAIEYLEKLNIRSLTYYRRAFRFHFFVRMNYELLSVEKIINKIFNASNIIDHCKDVPDIFAVATNSHPLSVPMKQVPMLFPYDSHYEKGTKLPTIQHTVFNNKIDYSILPEINHGAFTGPTSLAGWEIPCHYHHGITDIFTSIFGALYPPFSVQILASPEPLNCVGLITKTNQLVILINAKIASKNPVTISLIDDNPELCHYPIYEEAMNGILGPSTLFAGHVVLRISFEMITISIQRKYLYKQRAIDVYTGFGCHFTFVISSLKARKNLLNKIIEMTRNEETASIKSSDSTNSVNSFNLYTVSDESFDLNDTLPLLSQGAHPGPGLTSRLLNKSVEHVTRLWVNNYMSNFDYLLYLNVVSGRSFNDYSQYPVFPWILSYYSDESSTNNENDDNEYFRDLSKPMGQQSPHRAQKYDAIFSETNHSFFYGTHYSYPGAVLYYLLRIEPYTLHNVVFHHGFDHPDRVFLSINQVWRSASELNQSDVKELIPEFYCFSSMFENVNHYKFPQRSDGTQIDNVQLPNWGKDPITFVYLMRKSLECDEVSSKLHLWIDLIFGYKQRGEEAVQAKNLFNPLSYDESSQQNNEDDEETFHQVITNFGQCPKQLFISPHPQRIIKKAAFDLTNSQIKISRIKNLTCLKCHEIYDPSFLPSLLKSSTLKIDKLYVIDGKVKALPKFAHFLGSPHKLLILADGFCILDGVCQYAEPIFDITSSSVSNDGTVLTITNDCGMVLNYFYNANAAKLIMISRSLMPGTRFNCSSVSLHFSVVATSSLDNHLYLFDLTSGFLLRKVDTQNIITHIVFDEVHNYIICCDPANVYVYTLDFVLIMEHKTVVKTDISIENDDLIDHITMLSVGDCIKWSPTPFFITGHQSGNIIAWKINLIERLLDPVTLACLSQEINENNSKLNSSNSPEQLSSKAITAGSFFMSNKAFVCCNQDGVAYVISVTDIGMRILRSSYFESCLICNVSLNSNNVAVCTNCGLTFCTSCATPLSSPLCKTCQLSHMGTHRNIVGKVPPSSFGAIMGDIMQNRQDDNDDNSQPSNRPPKVTARHISESLK